MMFTLTQEQFATLRKHAIGEGLTQTLADLPYSASRDVATGDVLVRDARGNATRVAFDQYGFIGGVISPLGRRWQIENNRDGKMTAFTNPAGLRLEFEYDHEGRAELVTRDTRPFLSFGYGADGQVTKVVFPDRSSTLLQYQAKDQISAFTNRLGTQEKYEYNEDGLLESITDGNGNRTAFEYGLWNRPDRMVLPDGSTESYQYGETGFVRRIMAGAETVAEIEHNRTGQPTQIRYGDGNGSSFIYDANGKITEARNKESLARYQYDGKGRVLEEDQDGYVIKYRYDPTGILTGLTYPSGETVEYGYDADLRLTSIKDWTGGVHKFGYATGDRGITHYLPNGLVSTLRQSSCGLPLSIVVAKPEPVAPGSRSTESRRLGPQAAADRLKNLFWLEYQYDQEDRIRRFADSEFGVREYTYDPEGQLLQVKADRPELNEVFAYDGTGNRVKSNAGPAAVNALNQIIREGDYRYEYDSRGNMVTAVGPQGTWRYTWDSQSLLVQARGPRGQTVTFGYDAYGRRIWKRSSGKETRYVWAGEQMIREIANDERGTHVRDYLYYPGTYTPLAARIDGKVYCYHTDHLGTPRGLTDECGNIVWSADYRVFGQTWINVSTVSNPLRFPGQYFDSETGLHYNRFRYYSPALGRYLSRDPVSFGAGINLYPYVGSRPINGVDPLGLWGMTAFAGGILAGLAVGAAVLALAPAAVTAAFVAGAIVGGAVFNGLNEAIQGSSFCVPCFWKGFGEAFGALLGAAGMAAALMGGGPPALGGLALAGAGVEGAGALGLPAEQLMALGLGGGGALVAGGATVAMMKERREPESKTTEPPLRDRSGKIHTPMGEKLPSHVPDDWTREQLQEAERELQESIKVRKQEQIDLGEDAGHRNRIREEERLLRQIQKKLSGS